MNPMKVFEKSATFSGFVLPMIYSRRDVMRRAWDHSFGLIREGKLTVPIGASFPLAEARKAHEAVLSRQTVGKVLLMPDLLIARIGREDAHGHSSRLRERAVRVCEHSA